MGVPKKKTISILELFKIEMTIFGTIKITIIAILALGSVGNCK